MISIKTDGQKGLRLLSVRFICRGIDRLYKGLLSDSGKPTKKPKKAVDKQS